MSRIATCDYCFQEIYGSAENISQGSFDWCDEDCLTRWRQGNKVAQGEVPTDAAAEKSRPEIDVEICYVPRSEWPVRVREFFEKQKAENYARKQASDFCSDAAEAAKKHGKSLIESEFLKIKGEIESRPSLRIDKISADALHGPLNESAPQKELRILPAEDEP